MMEILICEKVPRIIKNRKNLEAMLGVKISNRGKEVTISGSPEAEYIAEKVIEALEFGFPFSIALLLKEENYIFGIINIKNHTKRKDLSVIRARIIGKKGKTLKTISDLTKCFFELKDNQIGIIGDAEHIRIAEDSVISLIHGAKQGNVYAWLEKHQPHEVIDLGLKPLVKKKQQKKK